MTADDELLAEFLAEGREHVDGLDLDLVALEQRPHDGDLVARIFRRVHTLKGAAGFLGFSALEGLAHAGEDLLADLRNGTLVSDRAIIDGLLALVDAVRELLLRIEATGDDGAADDELVALLRSLRDRPNAADDDAMLRPEAPGAPATADSAGDGDVDAGRTGARLGDILIERGVVRPEDVEDALGVQDQRSLRRAETTVRVETAALDDLMNLTSELVLARNALVAAADPDGDPELGAVVQRVGRVATDLQSAVTETRMRPIGGLWQKLPRVVRDLAAACGKQVRLELDGSGTELDKAVLETIKDPLTHLVRNAIDHGIEPPDVRLAAGKPAEGVLGVRAYHEHGRVNIEVRDDGGGIDLDRLATTYRRRYPGIEPPVDTTVLLELVFAPGVSTATEVTTVSGRGVGMDVVRSQIERVGGSVDLATAPGQGTTTTIRVPLTTAIMPALLVEAGDQRYAIPQVHVGEVLLVGADAFERVHDVTALRHRGDLLPLLRLDRVLDVGGTDTAIPTTVVVIEGDVRFGLAVAAVSDVVEIVVKPLAAEIRRLGMFAAATVLDDGRPALILDLSGVAKRAALTGIADGDESTIEPPPEGGRSDRISLLIADAAAGARCALRLDDVVRLERIPITDVQHAGGRAAVHRHGQILPLVPVAASEGDRRAQSGDSLVAVVVACGDRQVGLVVDRIVDVVHDATVAPGDSGDAATALVDGRLVELVDVPSQIGEPEPVGS